MLRPFVAGLLALGLQGSGAVAAEDVVVEGVASALVKQLLDPTLADGFDFPVGNSEGGGPYTAVATRVRYRGWKVTPSPGEEDDEYAAYTSEAWNGTGGGSTDAGQPVYAVAAGLVQAVRDSRRGLAVVTQHRFLENGKIRVMHSMLTGLADIQVAVGDSVKKRQLVGRIAEGKDGLPTQIYLEIYDPAQSGEDAFSAPTQFIRDHRKLTVPFQEPVLVIAVKGEYKVYLCKKGKAQRVMPVALGQNPVGHKLKDGDNCTPEGEYRIIQKARGPFDGDYGAYLGGAWMRLNYPNGADAKNAYLAKTISLQERDEILDANLRGGLPRGDTALGGGVGIHGWVSDWPDGPQNLTWGCLSLRSADLTSLYDAVSTGTKVIIQP